MRRANFSQKCTERAMKRVKERGAKGQKKMREEVAEGYLEGRAGREWRGRERGEGRGGGEVSVE